MQNQSNQDFDQDSEHTTFYDQADQSFSQKVTEKDKKLLKGVTSDDFEKEDETTAKAEDQVRQTEDASLQDDSYSFDEANTENEEYHDVDDAEEFGYDSEDDFLH